MSFRIPALSAIAVLSCQAAIAGTVTTTSQTQSSTTTAIFDTVGGIQPAFEDGPGVAGATLAGDSFFSTLPTNTSFASGANSVTTIGSQFQMQFALSATTPSDGGSIGVYIFADDGGSNTSGLPGAPTGTGVLVGTIADSALVSDAAVATIGGPAVDPLPRIKFDTSLLPTTLDGEYWVVLDMSDSSADLYLNADDSGLNATGQLSASNYDYSSGNVGGSASVQTLANQGLYPITVWDVVTTTDVTTTTTTTPAVPEPASMAVLGVAMAGLGIARRRKAV